MLARLLRKAVAVVLNRSAKAPDSPLLIFPAGLDHFAAGGAAAPLVRPLVLGRFCLRFGRLDIAAIIAAVRELVALLRQVCIKAVENRLVD